MNNFNINRLKYNPIIVMIGPRRCGKTLLIKSILAQDDSIKDISVITPTDKYNGSSLYDYNENQIQNINIEFPDLHNLLTSYINNKPNDKKCLIFEDSCFFTSNKYKDPQIINLLSDANKFNTIIIMTTQYPYYLPLEIHNMINYYFLFYWDFESNNIRLFNIFKTKFTYLEHFKTLFKNFTGNEWHHPMILDNHTNEIFGYQTPNTEWFGWTA